MATNDSMIQVKNLKKHYHRGAIKALDDVTVNINKGDVMVVIGPSGSGKSTFLRSLNLLEEPDRWRDHLQWRGYYQEEIQGCFRQEGQTGYRCPQTEDGNGVPAF